MNYISTRGGAAPAKFSEILLEGVAADGGLYVPEAWPQITLPDLTSWQTLPYAELAATILAKFAPEIPAHELGELTSAAYAPGVFSHARTDSDTAKVFPVRNLEPGFALVRLCMNFMARAERKLPELFQACF